MSIDSELAAFYRRNGFGEVPGSRPQIVRVYTGCMLVPLPNIETRRRFLKYHDLHHLITGYSVGRIGEGEISAWELGSGSAFVAPMLGVMNLIALSTGLVLSRARMWDAFLRGCRSKNLYPAATRALLEGGHWNDVDALRADSLERTTGAGPITLRAVEFGVYSCLALLIHACLAIPAVVARTVTDTMLGGSFFQAIKPTQRTDLY